jgi:hypothetical protein
LDVFGAVGGLIGIISMFVGAFVAAMAAPQFSSLVASKLYSWQIPKSYREMREGDDDSIDKIHPDKDDTGKE